MPDIAIFMTYRYDFGRNNLPTTICSHQIVPVVPVSKIFVGGFLYVDIAHMR